MTFHGVIRHWVTFLQVALFIRSAAIAAGRPAPVLSTELAKATIYHMPSTIKAMAKP